MIKRLLSVALCASFVLTSPAWAAEHKAPAKGGKEAAAKKESPGKEAPKKEPPKPKPAPAASHGGGGEGESPVGGATTAIQMMPMMAPYRTPSGERRYELLSVRIQLAPDAPSNDQLQRGACFMIPIVHEKMLLWLANAKLQAADFKDKRREVLETNLLKVAVDATGKQYFTGLKLVNASAPPLQDVGSDIQVVDSDPPLSQRSMTLTAQCK